MLPPQVGPSIVLWATRPWSRWIVRRTDVIESILARVRERGGRVTLAGTWILVSTVVLNQFDYQDAVTAQLLDRVAERLHPQQAMDLTGLQRGDLPRLQRSSCLLKRELSRFPVRESQGS
jgi:hypothetical protein